MNRHLTNTFYGHTPFIKEDEDFSDRDNAIIGYRSADSEVTIQEGVTSIEWHVFPHCNVIVIFNGTKDNMEENQRINTPPVLEH